MEERRNEHGITLIETTLAAAILMTIVVGLLPLFTTAVLQTEQQGNVATRTTEFAQDKMEHLMALDFNDAGLGGSMGVSSSVGSIPPAIPATNYVDYFDENGNTTAATTASYTRQWRISTDSTATVKTISVVVTSKPGGFSLGLAPSTTLVCAKSSGL